VRKKEKALIRSFITFWASFPSGEKARPVKYIIEQFDKYLKMKSVIILAFLFVTFSGYSQTEQPKPEVIERDGKLLYVVPAIASQEIILTVEILEQQQKAIKERKELLEKQMKAIQDEYAALTKQESDTKDWMIRLYKLKENPTAKKEDEPKNK